MHTNQDVLDDLNRNSSWLLQQLGQYAPISRDFVTKFAYETYPTPLPIGPALLVSQHQTRLQGATTYSHFLGLSQSEAA